MLADMALLRCFCSQCISIKIKCIQMPVFWKSRTHSLVEQHANRNGSMGKFLWRMSYKNNYWELIGMWTVYTKPDAQWINNNNYSRHLSNAASQNYQNEMCCVTSPVPTDKQHRKDESQLILAFFPRKHFQLWWGNSWAVGCKHRCNCEWWSVQAQLLSWKQKVTLL